MGIPRKSILFVLVLVSLLSPGAGWAHPAAKVKASVSRVSNKVVISGSAGNKTVWRKELPAYHSLFDHGQSPDQRYLFVWHQWWPPVKQGKQPKPASSSRITIYRVADGEVLADFTPGIGGSFYMVAGGFLVHAWGCGTNCGAIRIYRSNGEAIKTIGTTNGYKVDDRGYIATWPTLLADESGVRLYVSGRARSAS